MGNMNENKKIPRSELIAFCKKAYEDYGLSASSTDIYVSYMKNVAQYMEEKGIEFYDKDFSVSFLEEAKKLDYTVNHRRSKHYSYALSLVNNAIQGLPYMFHRNPQKEYDYPSCAIGSYAKEFIEEVKGRGLRKSTFRMYCHTVSEFSHSMKDMGYTAPEQISRKDVLEFVLARTTTNYCFYTVVGSFLSFLQSRAAIDSVTAHALDGRKKSIRKPLPSFYTQDEIVKIESAFDRDTKIGKRNYAMALLASRLGIRASDICHLQLENLDWKNNLIKLTQRKTGMELKLPLLADVGDAIIDYLRYARPATKCHTVFVSQAEPYRELNSSNMSVIIAKAIKKAGIETFGRHTGAHGLRHSLATAMMKYEARLQVISDTLGHSGTGSTMIYLHVDIDSLMECTHDVPPVGKEYYEQKGGAFYV